MQVSLNSVSQFGVELVFEVNGAGKVLYAVLPASRPELEQQELSDLV